MDSLTHVVVGAAIGMSVMGRRTALWKGALWGAVCNTLPDLDVFIDHGDAIRNMTFHRGESHALFYLTLFSPLLAAMIAKLHRETALFKRWWLAVWLALISHPLLDVMTVYGTRLALPFVDEPYGLGSIFIIDPLLTLPLLIGVIVALATPGAKGLRWAHAGLALGMLYLAWCAAAQQHVTGIAKASISNEGLQAERILVTPTAFNTVLWRVVVMTPRGLCGRLLLAAGPRASHPLRAASRRRRSLLGPARQLERRAHRLVQPRLLQDGGSRRHGADHRPAHGPGALLHVRLRGRQPAQRHAAIGDAPGGRPAARPRPRAAVAVATRAGRAASSPALGPRPSVLAAAHGPPHPHQCLQLGPPRKPFLGQGIEQVRQALGLGDGVEGQRDGRHEHHPEVERAR